MFAIQRMQLRKQFSWFPNNWPKSKWKWVDKSAILTNAGWHTVGCVWFCMTEHTFQSQKNQLLLATKIKVKREDKSDQNSFPIACLHPGARVARRSHQHVLFASCCFVCDQTLLHDEMEHNICFLLKDQSFCWTTQITACCKQAAVIHFFGNFQITSCHSKRKQESECHGMKFMHEMSCHQNTPTWRETDVKQKTRKQEQCCDAA